MWSTCTTSAPDGPWNRTSSVWPTSRSAAAAWASRAPRLRATAPSGHLCPPGDCASGSRAVGAPRHRRVVAGIRRTGRHGGTGAGRLATPTGVAGGRGTASGRHPAGHGQAALGDGIAVSAVPPKVTAGHLRRDAYLYVRQSTVRQVFLNTESARQPVRAARPRGGARLGHRTCHRHRCRFRRLRGQQRPSSTWSPRSVWDGRAWSSVWRCRDWRATPPTGTGCSRSAP